jgi:hypothetical protein
MIDDNMTLAEHAERWWQMQGNDVPQKDSADYTKMYEEWIDFAFRS